MLAVRIGGALSVPDDTLSQVSYAQLLHVGTQHFSSLRRVFGVNPVRVLARADKVPWSGYAHGSTTEAFVEMEGGIHVHYRGELTSHRNEYELRIEGEHGGLRADLKRVWWRQRGWRFFMPLRQRPIPAATSVLLDQLQAAVQRTGETENHGEDDLWTLAMCEAAIHSDKTQRPVLIADVFSSAGLSQFTTSAEDRETGS